MCKFEMQANRHTYTCILQCSFAVWGSLGLALTTTTTTTTTTSTTTSTSTTTTVLSRASAHTRASAHPPILTVLWFFRLLRVTHIAAIVLMHSGTTTSGIKGSHTLVHGLVCSVLPLQHKIHVLQATTKRCGNIATRLRVVHFVARYSFLHCRAGLNESRTNRP